MHAKQGQQFSILSQAINYEGTGPLDLSGYTLTSNMKTGAVVVPLSPVITDAKNGFFRLDCQSGASQSGDYLFDVKFVKSQKTDYSNTESITIQEIITP